MEHFLQSHEWEEFQKSVGREVFRIGDALVIKLPLAFGKSYLYCVGTSAGRSLRKNFAPRGDVIFLKLEPMAEDGKLEDSLLKAGFIKSKKEIQPQRTIILDITRSEEELLASMHKKTRYNIRVAQKKDVRFKIYDLREGSDNFEAFWQLLQETTERDKFQAHPKSYYEKLLSSFSSRHTTYDIPYTKLFYVEYKDKVISASIVIFHNHSAAYLHGASDHDYRALMAPYLLHWEVIKYAKDHGFSEYDLWGIDEEKWPGVTRFKKGFSGREVKYTGSYDYVFMPIWYRLYRLWQALFKR